MSQHIGYIYEQLANVGRGLLGILRGKGLNSNQQQQEKGGATFRMPRQNPSCDLWMPGPITICPNAVVTWRQTIIGLE